MTQFIMDWVESLVELVDTSQKCIILGPFILDKVTRLRALLDPPPPQDGVSEFTGRYPLGIIVNQFFTSYKVSISSRSLRGGSPLPILDFTGLLSIEEAQMPIKDPPPLPLCSTTGKCTTPSAVRSAVTMLTSKRYVTLPGECSRTYVSLHSTTRISQLTSPPTTIPYHDQSADRRAPQYLILPNFARLQVLGVQFPCDA